MMKYPVYKPELTAKEKEYVNDCLDSTWISSRGKYIERFEKQVSEFTGAKYAQSVHNGTVAIHLALLALDIKPEDEVIVPDFTYIATANAVKYIGAKPVLIDVDPLSWNITIESIAKAITPKTKAIIVVDIYGCPVDIDPIIELADKHNITVIEDAAESLGAEYKNRKAGNLAHIASLSFFGNKTITTGEGGMLLTNDKLVSTRIAQLKNQGNSFSTRYFHDVLGYNYRMTNIQAAIGCAQMERIESILERKRNILKYYKARLGSKVVFQNISDKMVSSYWMISMLLKDKTSRLGLESYLEKQGIETRPFFYPVSEMPFYDQADTPVTKKLSDCGIIMPSYPMLTESDVDFISNKILEYLVI